MSSLDPTKHPLPGTDPAERRRETRLDFTNRCLFAVHVPAWAITPKALEGRTDNITTNGLRINALTTMPGQAHSWFQAVKDDVELLVQIVLPEIVDFPTLRGRIVWVFEPDLSPKAAQTDAHLCSVGILFSIMREKEKAALQDLMRMLPGKF